MAYFIFLNNLNNIEGTIYRIAENQSDLNNINIDKTNYKIIEDSQTNFESVKYGNKHPIKYEGSLIVYENIQTSFNNKETFKNHINSIKMSINNFLKNNFNHPSVTLWNSYYNQLNSLNLDSITYPLNKSLEQYFNDSGQLSLNPLQLP